MPDSEPIAPATSHQDPNSWSSDLPTTPAGVDVSTLTEEEKAAMGLPYLANSPFMVRARVRVRRLLKLFNQSDPGPDPEDLREGERAQGVGFFDAANDPDAGLTGDVMGKERRRLFGQVLGLDMSEQEGGRRGDGWEKMRGVEVEPPFFCDYGTNIHLEGTFYANAYCTILDCAGVTIGTNVFFGPSVSIYGGTHSTSLRERCTGAERALPVKIGRDVWCGGNVTILAGVTIGEGSTIGAGSVVTKDVEPFSVMVGNPARKIKTVPPKERRPAEDEV